jgi:hypothetical protein
LRLSVIIPVAANVLVEDAKERRENLRCVLDWLDRQSGTDLTVVVVEQLVGGAKKAFFVPAMSLRRARLVTSVVASDVFNKPWLYNIGERMAVGENLMFGEADVVGKTDMMSAMLRGIHRCGYRWAMCWSNLYYTDARERKALLKGGMVGAMRNCGIAPRKNRAEGGLVYFNRQLFHAIGGYNEWIEEIGGPDNEINLRARFWTGQYPVMAARLFHLDHARVPILRRPYRLANVEVIKDIRRNRRALCRALRQLGPQGGKVPMSKVHSWQEFRDLVLEDRRESVAGVSAAR